MINRVAKFQMGQVVHHRVYSFRGVIFDIDPTFNNTDEWWESIPADVRPHKDQPYYHLLAENEATYYIAYVSEAEPGGRRDRRAGRPPRGRRDVR